MRFNYRKRTRRAMQRPAMLVDAAGYLYDPELCREDENGQPMKTKNGLWLMNPGQSREQLTLCL